jgi:LPXTG-motif cell wall-anchored protein
MTQGTVQLIAGVLCVLLIAVIFLRRKGKKKTEEDEF